MQTNCRINNMYKWTNAANNGTCNVEFSVFDARRAAAYTRVGLVETSKIFVKQSNVLGEAVSVDRV